MHRGNPGQQAASRLTASAELEANGHRDPRSPARAAGPAPVGPRRILKGRRFAASGTWPPVPAASRMLRRVGLRRISTGFKGPGPPQPEAAPGRPGVASSPRYQWLSALRLEPRSLALSLRPCWWAQVYYTAAEVCGGPGHWSQIWSRMSAAESGSGAPPWRKVQFDSLFEA